MHVAKHCLYRKYAHVAFLDPERVNEKICGGVHGCDVEDLTSRLIEVSEQFKMHNKTNILLTYNYEYVFSALIFMLFLVKIIR